MKKYSRQRETILAELSSVVTHPTASEVYDMVRLKLPNISLGTVYRNLSVLSEGGVVQRITTGDGSERFDANPNNHYHFCCTKCGSVSDVDMPVMDINAKAEMATGCKIFRHSLVLYGHCAECCACERREEEGS